MAQTLGVVGIVRNGTSIDVQKGAKIKLSGFKQNVVNVSGKTHFAQEWVNGEITATTVLKRGQSLSQFLPNGQEELQIKCDTGQKFDIVDAFLMETPETDGDGEGGKIQLKWGYGDFVESVA